MHSLQRGSAALIGVLLLALGSTSAASQEAQRAATPISIGQTVLGQLEAADPMLDDDSYYDLYRFRGRAGQRVVITLHSPEFDAYLTLGRQDGGEMEFLAGADDGGGGTDARISFTLPAEGEYLIRANSLGARETGSYALTLEERAAAAPPTPQPVQLGQSMGGELRDSDAQLDDGSFYHLWTYGARAGEQLRITLRSDAFDAYLEVGRLVDGEFQTIADDDDGAGGTDALLELTLREAGSYVIRAQSLLAEQTGAYTLLVEKLR